MEKYVVQGGARLSGAVEVSGAKNAALAILAATVLAEEPCIIENIPSCTASIPSTVMEN